MMIGDNSPASSAGLPERLTQEELARHWRVTTRTLERWRACNLGPAWMKLEGRILYRAEDILAFETARTRGSEVSS